MTPREHREYEIADLVWVPSTFTAESLTRYGIDKSKIEVLPYGVNLDVFDPGDQVYNGFSILYVGEVSPEKGAHILLKSAKRLPEVEVTLVGKVSARLRDDVEAADNIDAPGWVHRRNLPEYFRKASVFVFPSFADGYPSAVLEAMACGCPVVTTLNVGTRALIKEYDAGVVLEPGSVTAIVETVKQFRDDTDRVQHMSDSAVAAIRDGDFGLERREQKMADFMNSIAE
jgi:glycosyltransferase involved in cell wall biosynthesis